MSATKPLAFERLFVMTAVLPLLFIAGIQLFVFAEQTETYFAWTIALPLTAAFMGAGYWSAMVNAYMVMRQPEWSRIRTSIAASLAATGMLGIMTFLHLDKFHLASPALLTRFVTWVWIAVYVVTSPVFLITWIVQARRPEGEARAARPLPGWTRAGFAIQAGATLILGLALFIAPSHMIPSWPWDLTPLTARAVGTWLSAYGLACLAVFRENNASHGAGTTFSLLAFCVLQIVVLLRYLSSLDWARPLTWFYVALLLLGILSAVGGLQENRSLKA